MSRTLLINASPFISGSRAHDLGRRTAEALIDRSASAGLVERDLSTLTPLPQAYAEAIVGMKPHDDEAFTLSETLIREIEETGRLIITTPMHNYTVPASLKLWIDYILRYGRTFASEEGQKYGLLANRPTLIIITSGGLVSPPAAMQPDHLTGYLRDVFATLGITDLRFVYLEGLVRHDMSDAIVDAGWDAILEDHAFGEAVAA